MTTPIKQIVQNIFARQKDWRLKIIQKWPAIVGPLHERVSIEKITEDTVYLTAIDSCWLTEIYMLSTLVLKNINDTFEYPRIKYLKFSLKDSKNIKPLHAIAKPQEAVHKTMPISFREKKALETVKDKTLQEALEKFLIRCKQQ